MVFRVPCVDSMLPHPELFFNGAGVGLGVQAVHVVVDWAQLIGRDGGVPAETRLQDGVMDEDVLLLRRERDKLDLTGVCLLSRQGQSHQCRPSPLEMFF